MAQLFKVGAIENWFCEPRGDLKVLRAHLTDQARMIPELPNIIKLD
jgi:hypothetical protein